MATFIIYKSSAGSGKTTVLIRSFLKLSLGAPSPHYFKKILAVTFTNKAATEMKERLIAELNEMSQLTDDYAGGKFMIDDLLEDLNLSVGELQKRARAMFDEVLQSYDELGISTIDQFNHRLIRSFSRELAISSDFEVETEEKPLFAEAIGRLMEKVGVDSYITKHLTSYIELQLDEEKGVKIKRDLEELRGMVLNESSYDAIKYIAAYPPEKFEAIRNDIFKKVKSIEKKVREKGTEAIEKLHSAGLAEGDLFHSKSGVYGFFKKLMEMNVGDKLINSYVEKTIDGKWLVAKPSPEVESRLSAIQPSMDHLLQECVELVTTELPKYFFLKSILDSIDLIAVLEELSACFEEVCEERNVLPISRFNRLISDAIRKEPAAYIYENYGARYHHILIDEFQDTSEMQWFNLLPLIEESLSQGHLNLVVGDGKQSIYRWRGSKAEQLIELPNLPDLPPDFPSGIRNVLAESSEIVPLSKNYRSKDNIVAFNNFLIGALGERSFTPGSIYSKEYHSDNVRQDVQQKPGGYIEIKKLEKDAQEMDKWDALVNQIYACKEAGFGFGDMAILVRSTGKEGRKIVDRLRKSDIPVDTSQSFELDKNLQVSLILSTIRMVADKYNNAAKVTAMRCLSEMHGFEFDPTTYVVKIGKKNYIDFDAFLDDHKLAPLPKNAGKLGLFDLTEILISTYATDAGDPFITSFTNLVYSKFGMGSTPAAFITWWDELSEKPSAGIPNNGDAIQIMTIHKAKGLQFKVVLVPDFNWKLRTNHKELRWFHLKHPKRVSLDYAPLPLNSKLQKMGLEEEWSAEEEANSFDNLNLAYVAVTRAEEALFLNYQQGQKNEINRFLDEITELIKNEASFDSHFEGGDEAFSLKIGELYCDECKDCKQTETATPNSDLHYNSSWSSNIKFAFQPDSQDMAVGNHFHRIMSQSITLSDAKNKLKALMDRAHIDEGGFRELNQMIESVYADAWFSSLVKDAEIFQEREFLKGDEVSRPDLVVKKDGKVTVIDWKTGGEKPEHKKQIQQYASAIREMENCPCEAYLIYFSPFNKQKVALPAQTSIFD